MSKPTMRLAIVFGTLLVATACEEATTGVTPDAPNEPRLNRNRSVSVREAEATIRKLVEETNARLEAEGAEYRIERATYITSGYEAGRTIFFDDRTWKFGQHFVPGDPRRANGNNLDIAYMVDQVQLPTSFDAATTTAAIDRAMATWDGVECSTIPITQLANIPALDIGLVAGGFPSFFLGADITHAGWLPTLGGLVLGVSIPFGFIDSGGNFTDINNDGMIDTAFWEIYYSDAFGWADDGVSNVDIESIALHEAGHGLDQGHFGTLFQTDRNGFFHFAPRAVMNAGYTGPQRTISETDLGGHCSIWGSWPER